MLNRDAILGKFTGLNEGAPVYSLDGEKLGKIIMLSDDSFTVEKGFFFPQDFTLRYDDIQDVRDGSIYVSQNQADFSDWKRSDYQGWNQVNDINEGRLNAQPRTDVADRFPHLSNLADRENRTYMNETATSRTDTSSKNETRVPIVEEKLEARKTMRESGQIRVRKVVHTELKHLTIPVMREEVKVERVAAGDSRMTDRMGDVRSDFKETDINIPVMEEQVEVIKKPVLKEEVRISKESRVEQRDVSGEVRREDVRVEGTDQIDQVDQIDKKRKIS